MAVSTIKLTGVRIKSCHFDDLAQYTNGPYYLTIATGLKSKAGIPSNATIIAVNIRGWAGLETVVNVGLYSTDGLYVFYSYGTTISSDSYITVQIAYIV